MNNSLDTRRHDDIIVPIIGLLRLEVLWANTAFRNCWLILIFNYSWWVLCTWVTQVRVISNPATQIFTATVENYSHNFQSWQYLGRKNSFFVIFCNFFYDEYLIPFFIGFDKKWEYTHIWENFLNQDSNSFQLTHICCILSSNIYEHAIWMIMILFWRKVLFSSCNFCNFQFIIHAIEKGGLFCLLSIERKQSNISKRKKVMCNIS